MTSVPIRNLLLSRLFIRSVINRKACRGFKLWKVNKIIASRNSGYSRLSGERCFIYCSTFASVACFVVQYIEGFNSIFLVVNFVGASWTTAMVFNCLGLCWLRKWNTFACPVIRMNFSLICCYAAYGQVFFSFSSCSCMTFSIQHC